MDFEISWLLLGLPAAFVLGWLASRFDWRQQRLNNRLAPKAYFRGLNHLLNEQQDQAIDAFIEAVRNDPETSELHFALGNLFRRRGEFDRAVRVHEHLLARGDLNTTDRQRAQYALALDFLKAGLIDRAEDALRKLEGTRHATQAGLALLGLYERARDWAQAQAMAERLHADGQGDFAPRIAHYLCEQAQACLAAHDAPAAKTLLDRAIAQSPASPRPWIDLADWHTAHGLAGATFATLQQAFEQVALHARPLLAPGLARCARTPDQMASAQAVLERHYGDHPSFDVLDALVRLAHAAATSPAAAAAAEATWLERHLRTEASLAAASRWLALHAPASPPALDPAAASALVQRTLERAAQPLLRYRCAACGFETQQHRWQCPGCLTWDSYPARRVEEL